MVECVGVHEVRREVLLHVVWAEMRWWWGAAGWVAVVLDYGGVHAGAGEYLVRAGVGHDGHAVLVVGWRHRRGRGCVGLVRVVVWVFFVAEEPGTGAVFGAAAAAGTSAADPEGYAGDEGNGCGADCDACYCARSEAGVAL